MGVDIRIELDIEAKRVINRLHLENLEIDKLVAQGITNAIEELSKENNLIDLVCQATKNRIKEIVIEAANEWELKHKLKEAIRNKIIQKVEIYSDELIDKFYKATEDGITGN